MQISHMLMDSGFLARVIPPPIPRWDSTKPFLDRVYYVSSIDLLPDRIPMMRYNDNTVILPRFGFIALIVVLRRIGRGIQ